MLHFYFKKFKQKTGKVDKPNRNNSSDNAKAPCSRQNQLVFWGAVVKIGMYVASDDSSPGTWWK